MKCEKCGKNEANYYYSSNINGKVTEKHLCSECAREFEHSEDYATVRSAFGNMNSMMDSMFSNMFAPRRSLLGSMFDPWDDFGFGLTRSFMPRFGLLLGDAPSETEEKKEAHSDLKKPNVEIDGEMNKRRQINTLRHQMHEAAVREDYEKAAELRDQIRALENPEEKSE